MSTKVRRHLILKLMRALPGSKASRRAHVRRALLIQQSLSEKRGIEHFLSWKVSHFRWFLDQEMANRAMTTRSDYWRTMRALAAALGKWPQWEPHLRGPWSSESGKGRPPRLPGKVLIQEKLRTRS